MHELVRELVESEVSSPVLARLPLDEGALIAAFPPRGNAPLWVAKTAYGISACWRLRAEAQALERLAPLAEALNLPRLLAWRESGSGANTSACLVQSTIDGNRRPCRWSGDRPWAELPRALAEAAEWLRRFQYLAPADALGLAPGTLAALAAETSTATARDRRLHPEWAPLLTALPAMAPDVSLRTTAVHGDFWWGNFLWQKLWRAAVVDWSGLSAGSALDDMLTFTAHLPCGSRSRPWTRLMCWQALWFSPGSPRDFLRAWARNAGYTEGDARCAFYLFLQRRMRWELGLGLQARSIDDRVRAARDWSEAIRWLAQHRFPDPFTPMPR